MAEPTPISTTNAVQSRTKSTPGSPRPPRSTTRTKPPVVIPEEFPATTMRRIFQEGEYESMAAFLQSYQRCGDLRRWEDFRLKIPPDLLKTWGRVLVECRRNGYVRPIERDGRIVWYQILDNGHERNGDLCTLCYRECQRREWIDTGELKYIQGLNPGYQEKKPCWTGA